MISVSEKLYSKSKHTFLCSVTFLEHRAVYEIVWNSIVERGRPQVMTTWRMHISCRITKATNTHSQYVILITFPLQQRLQERASMLRHT